MEVSARHGFLKIDGLRLHYRDTGAARSPALVLLHGLGATAHYWSRIEDAFSDRFRVLALDFRGCGDSDRTDQYSFEALTRDVAAFADQLGLDRFSLVGHSMGGSVALIYAEDHSNRLHRLVIEDTPPPFGGDRSLPPNEHTETFASPQELVDAMHASRPWVDIDAAGHMLRRRADGRWEPNWDARLARAIVAQLNHPEPAWWERLPEIRVPTLMLLASRSHVPAEKTRAAAALIPDCRLVEFESGHTIHVEAPDAFVAALQDFL